ncbi:hypothetical protein F7Q99_27620 [Streptomyces kaniharaensis]|uniref:SMI1/KNR4 family protein n=1 Tax=Streptomyces kaniharaensis TaxID=212423 RepID=A0A6N7KWA4_9ACTN|nr:hypothetical protein [Streptomyces kaniharaensis]MQS15922.1 hypothetical protein [Streptomyces kaniharaensis]
MRDDVRELAGLAGWVPQGAYRMPWSAALRAIGIGLPSDYREFIDVFGAGEIRGDLGILDPLPRPGGVNVADGISRMVRRTTEDIGLEFRAMREESFDLCPYQVYPEAGGLLMWAGNYNGDICFWLTEGADPDRWPVIVWHRGRFPDGWSRYDMGMVEFLLLVVAGETPELADLAFQESAAPIWVPEMFGPDQ